MFQLLRHTSGVLPLSQLPPLLPVLQSSEHSPYLTQESRVHPGSPFPFLPLLEVLPFFSRLFAPGLPAFPVGLVVGLPAGLVLLPLFRPAGLLQGFRGRRRGDVDGRVPALVRSQALLELVEGRAPVHLAGLYPGLADVDHRAGALFLVAHAVFGQAPVQGLPAARGFDHRPGPFLRLALGGLLVGGPLDVSAGYGRRAVRIPGAFGQLAGAVDPVQRVLFRLPSLGALNAGQRAVQGPDVEFYLGAFLRHRVHPVQQDVQVAVVSVVVQRVNDLVVRGPEFIEQQPHGLVGLARARPFVLRPGQDVMHRRVPGPRAFGQGDHFQAVRVFCVAGKVPGPVVHALFPGVLGLRVCHVFNQAPHPGRGRAGLFRVRYFFPDHPGLSARRRAQSPPVCSGFPPGSRRRFLCRDVSVILPGAGVR